MTAAAVEHAPASSAEHRRWAICFGAVFTVHAIPALIAAFWLAPLASVSAPPPSIVMIDLASIPAAPAAPPAPRPPQAAAPKPLALVKTAKLLRADTADVALPAAEEPPRQPRSPTPMQPTAAPPMAAAPPAPAPRAAATPSNAAPTWQGLLLARLEQFKRYPAQAQSRRQQGVAALRFTLDRDGKVLSARIVKSSGYAALDDETLALIRRAEPLPRPPPEVPGNPIELVVPIEFSLHGRD